MKKCPQVVFQVLTKRPVEMRDFCWERYGLNGVPENIWLGTSVESRKYFGRLTALYECPSKIHFASFEPLLESLGPDLNLSSLQWAIVGAESGTNRRPFDPVWALEIRDLCKANGVAFYFKQGSHRFSGRNRELDGRLWEEFPNV